MLVAISMGRDRRKISSVSSWQSAACRSSLEYEGSPTKYYPIELNRIDCTSVRSVIMILEAPHSVLYEARSGRGAGGVKDDSNISEVPGCADGS